MFSPHHWYSVNEGCTVWVIKMGSILPKSSRLEPFSRQCPSLSLGTQAGSLLASHFAIRCKKQPTNRHGKEGTTLPFSLRHHFWTEGSCKFSLSALRLIRQFWNKTIFLRFSFIQPPSDPSYNAGLERFQVNEEPTEMDFILPPLHKL